MLKAYWVSWYEPVALHPTFEYHGPHWISGESGDGEQYTICAAVMAKDEDDAKRIMLSAYDVPPADVDWRFVNEETTGSPFNDRFIRADWMLWPFPGADGKPRP